MANAKRCDRCNEYYTPSKLSRHKTSGRIFGGFISGVATIDENYGLDSCYDLCDKCLYDFYEFMNNKVAS